MRDAQPIRFLRRAAPINEAVLLAVYPSRIEQDTRVRKTAPALAVSYARHTFVPRVLSAAMRWWTIV